MKWTALADTTPQGLTIAVSVSSFGVADEEPRRRLEQAGVRIIENPHGRTLTESEIGELLETADGLIAGTEPLTAAVLEASPRLHAISRVGIGLDNVDLAAAARLGIAIFNTPDAVTDAAAELTLGGMLATMRHLQWMDGEMRAGRWSRKMGNLLRGRTVGIVGIGRVGKRVAGLLEPFGVRRIGFDVFPNLDWASANRVTLQPFERVLAEADVITLHTSTVPDIGPMIGAAEMATMRPGAVIVNTARGGLVDEAALAVALLEGRLGAAYLDVFGEEPYTGPLRDVPNVLLSPHAGSYAEEARRRMEGEAVDQLLAFLIGGGPR
jgi:D-3-phosphoglycerate dehydrogenase